MSIIKTLERKILDISFRNKLSHIGSCLTALPIILEIYQTKEHGEKVIISCGHCHLAHAVVMEHYGIIESAEENIKKHGIHCEFSGGCDCSTGSLGQGLPIALGMAMADRSKNVYCLISDGEATEGSIYEALNIRRKYKVDNLKVVCNFNGWGAYDETSIETVSLISNVDKKKMFSPLHGIDVIDTTDHWFIKQYGQEAHYKALNEKEYAEIIRQHFA